MDQAQIFYAVIIAFSAGLALAYLALVASTPPPLQELPSENNYRAPKDPNTSRPLPSIQDAASLDLSIIIPAYNETQRLPSMLSSTLEHLSSFPKRSFEILIIDDGSSDGTASLELNRGKGGAVRHGMLHARGRRLLMLLLDALDSIAPTESDAAGIAIGSRAHLVKTEAVVKRSFIRNFLMYGLHTVLRIAGVGHVRDTQCGFKLFSRAAARALFPRQHLATWIFDVEILLLAKTLSIPVVEVPVTWNEVAGSKLSVVQDSLRMLRDLLVLRANQLLGRWTMGEEKLKAD
ncbi:nucleotide-diphospho-sugar transferase [Multifurca ochricompacta]|uniref:dolichyl-phosphate beta-glucosyltransferase n=1 Tax=Multifurca ochricompacta TaxID=376703 RepID=A0AAD4LZM8_9AGAM|nr:nucleotide-diphospho-sugar transferase [Multifurca ochricompacta]